MALTNYDRQKKWREKNRAIYNLRRRQARKVAGSQPYEQEPSQLSRVEELRQLMSEAKTAPTEPDVKLAVYRNDYGQVITEGQWKQLQAIKAKAKEGGYEIDEYSQ